MYALNSTVNLFQSFGTPELILLLVLAVFLFGAKKLPELAKGVGKSMGELKKSVKEVAELDDEDEEEDKKKKDKKPAKKTAKK